MTHKEIILCRYCKAPFKPRESGGSKQEFCSAAHRKLFNKYGGQTFTKQVDRIRREVLIEVRRDLRTMVAEEIRSFIKERMSATLDLRQLLHEMFERGSGTGSVLDPFGSHTFRH